MGTLTITMGSFGAQATGWPQVAAKPVRKTHKALPTASVESKVVPFIKPEAPLALRASVADLPHLRDSRGTLLAPYQEVRVDRFAEGSAEGEDWRGGATAAPVPVVDAAKAAEQDAQHRLVYACMRGDSAAWQQLVVSQHRRVYGICYRFTGSPSDAEDLTQDVFLKVYRNLAGFDPEKGAFTTWLTALTRNLLVDHFRRTRQDRATDSLDESVREGEDGPTMADRLADTRPSAMHRVAQMELRVRIQHALKQLSPELREAVILRDLQDMDYKEIAAVLKVPEGTVKSRISRGRAEMARMLGRSEGQVM
jgi:RNA polymerase sigma factor (sigma-70 family)